MTAEEIDKQVKEHVRKALHDAAYDIAFDIEAAYESAVDAFYNSYTPHVYPRNYYTYTGSDSHSDYEKHVNFTDKDFTAGIKVGSEFVQGSYKDPTDYVFHRTYYYGIHGTIAKGGVMPVPPERIMQMSFDGIKESIGSYIDKYM